MRRAVHMEWTKLRTAPGTGWWVLAVVGLTIGLSAFTAATVDAVNCAPRCDLDPGKLGLSGVYLGQIAVVALAALVVTSEYDTMMIRTTLAAAPRRLVVLAAKLGVVTAVVLAAALAGVAGAWLAAGRGILPRHGFTAAHGYPPASLADPVLRRAYLGTVLYLGLVALLSAGAGVVLRHTAAAVSVVLGLLYVMPIVAQFIPDPRWHDRILRYSPMSAGLAIQATRGLAHQPVGPWPGLGILALYAAGALLAGAVLFARRDA
jgi:ABC-2 type transport system permease protein